MTIDEIHNRLKSKDNKEYSRAIVDLANFIIGKDQFDYRKMDDFANTISYSTKEFNKSEDLNIKLIEEIGNTEGAGEYAALTISITINQEILYFTIEGYYSSYDPTDWDEEFIRVVPKQISKIIYEPL